MALGHLIVADIVVHVEKIVDAAKGSEDGADYREPERQGLDDPGADYEEYAEDHRVLAFSTR